MTAPEPEHSRGSPTRKRAVVLALRYYGRQLARLRRFTVPAMLFPALGNTCNFYRKTCIPTRFATVLLRISMRPARISALFRSCSDMNT